MDIDEFLDRELSELDLATDKTEKAGIELPLIKEDFEPSPLFDGIRASLSKGSLEDAEQAYAQLWRILLQQKLKWNKELYEQLSISSRQFSSTLNSAYNELKRKADHINELINRAKASLREGKKELPFKLYSEIEEINNSITSIFFEEKKIIQDQILDFYKELKNTTDNELIRRVFILLNEINRLIDKINLAIGSNDMANAAANYNKCVELYNQVPEGFLRYKNVSGMQLLGIYKNLSISTEISSLQKHLSQQTSQLPKQTRQQSQPDLFAQTYQQMGSLAKLTLLSAKRERAKMNIEKGFYDEASKDIQEALQLEPKDAEAKAIHAKIKTLQ